MGLWEKGRNLLDILHRLGDCKGGWRLAAGTRSCCKSPVIQNDENQLVDKMVKDEKSLKMKAAHLKTFVSTQNVCMQICLPFALGPRSFCPRGPADGIPQSSCISLLYVSVSGFKSFKMRCDHRDPREAIQVQSPSPFLLLFSNH